MRVRRFLYARGMDFTSMEFSAGYGVLMFLLILRAIRMRQRQDESPVALPRMLLTALVASVACTLAVLAATPVVLRALARIGLLF